MKALLVKLLLFSLPFLLLFGFPLFVIVAAGELTPAEEVVAVQQSKDKLALYQPAYNDMTTYYKLLS